VQLPNGKIGCADTALSAPCAGQPFNAAATTFKPEAGSSEIVGAKIFTLWPTGNATPFVLTCLDTTSNIPCSGWGTKTPDPLGVVGILYPLLNAAGTVTGICTRTSNTAAAAFVCYDVNSGTLIRRGPSPEL
jgi:hypothetical protein